jgi:heme-degrading monooxygenase HmoA
MYSVIFEVHPHPSKWDAYLAVAKSLKPHLEQVPGFIRNIRYRSLRRPGWVLSLSDWEDEKALVRWRTREGHHMAQEKGRAEILEDYHLRVGQTADSPAEGQRESERNDVTLVGEGSVVTLVEATLSAEMVAASSPEEVAANLGLPDTSNAPEILSWDIFDAVLTPGDVILLCTWKDETSSGPFLAGMRSRAEADRVKGLKARPVRVLRDYGKYDRREAPQFYPDAQGRETLHA